MSSSSSVFLVFLIFPVDDHLTKALRHEVLTVHLSLQELGKEKRRQSRQDSSKLLFPRSRLVKEELTTRALKRDIAPEEPMLFLLKSSSVKEEFAARALERDAAPESPISFPLKFKLVNEELTARVWEREAAPEAPILFPLKYSLVKEVFA